MDKHSAVHVVSAGQPTVFSYDDENFIAGSLVVPLKQVIAASFASDTRVLAVDLVKRKKKKGSLLLAKLSGIVVKAVANDAVQLWVEALLAEAYKGVKRGRRLRVIVNPYGGVRKGPETFSKIVEPILLAADCTLDIIHTTHSGHAFEIAKTMSLDYDAVLSVSGDGLVHEIMNGFAEHAQPSRVFAIPIAPIPTGSGNGLALNLLGIEDGFDTVAAALNAVKGLPMRVDVCSVIQNGKRSLSYMSQALGLMADLDLGTENLRWMGDLRFTLGFLRGGTSLLVQWKPCPVELSYKAAEVDKTKMVHTLNSRRQLDKLASSSSVAVIESSTGLPPVKYSTDDVDGWTTFDKPLLYVFGGKGPYVGRDLMAFPVSLPNDGLIDIVAQTLSTSRGEMLKSFSTAHKGELYWNTSLHYIKAYAYRIKPLAPKGYLSIDGEAFPFEEFQVEIHQELATLLSPYGYYAADFPEKAAN
ncbi:ATP-NAD kinase-like domain-containing protein [Mycena floridula]|nr:ATP-NAD kinase-like domain-containing protein [Mycena floridula]